MKTIKPLLPAGAADQDSQRWLAVAGGIAALALGMRRSPGLRLMLASTAGGLLYRGLTGRNPLRALTPLLRGGAGHATHLYAVGSVVIARPAQALYAFWRNFENLPTFMHHLESVQVLDPLHSHWRVTAPAGTSVEWDAEVTRDVPGQEIAWRSLPGSDVENWGSVRFRQIIDGRGTELQVRLNYRPPAGRMGAVVASLFGEEPQQQIEDDLARLKQLLEAGSLPGAAGADAAAGVDAAGGGGEKPAASTANAPNAANAGQAPTASRPTGSGPSVTLAGAHSPGRVPARS